MRFTIRAMSFALLALGMRAGAAEAQRADSYRWFLGAQAGVMIFQTPAQTSTGVPTFGVQTVIVAKRTGLLLSVDEAFGSDEISNYSDPGTQSGFRQVSFNHIRKYSAVLTAFPFNGSAQPYFGVGVGILHTVRPEADGVFASSSAADFAQEEARQRGSTGFGTFIAGVQFGLGGAVGFGQYQITTAPNDGKLFKSSTHTFVGGVRFSLGSAREGVRGGGY